MYLFSVCVVYAEPRRSYEPVRDGGGPVGGLDVDHPSREVYLPHAQHLQVSYWITLECFITTDVLCALLNLSVFSRVTLCRCSCLLLLCLVYERN